MADLLPLTVSTIAVLVFGVVWYSPRVFGAVWSREAGMTRPLDAEAATKALVLGALQNFVIVYLVAQFQTLSRAAETEMYSIVLFLAILVAATHLGAAIYERKSMTYYLITVGYLITSLFLAAFILDNWPWA